MVIEEIYKQIYEIKDRARQDALMAENISLKAQVDILVAENAELKLQLGNKTKEVSDVKVEVESLSLKVSEYEKKKGTSPVQLGLNQGEKLSLRQQLNALPTNSERLAFYQKHKTELDRE
jgi:hypothetical protein